MMDENQKVYLVENYAVPGGYSTECTIQAAFSTLQKAEEYKAVYGGDIVTWELDLEFWQPTAGMRLYLLDLIGSSYCYPNSVQKPASIVEAKLSHYSVKQLNKFCVRRVGHRWLISLYCEARDEQHALEIWTEKFTAYLE